MEANAKNGSGPWAVHRSQFAQPQIQAADGRLVTDRVFNGFEDLAGAAPELLDALKALLDLDIYAHGEGVVTVGAVNQPEVNAAHALVNRLG